MEQFPATTEEREEKARTNREMFDGIARRYDLLNRVMSLGLDRRWRRRLVELCEISAGDRCLDICCGTGDVTRLLARTGAEATGLDASENMLAMAHKRGGDHVAFVLGDALNVPFSDNTFDAVTIAFGNRNVASLDMLFAEMRRVAKPGGRIVSLEINRPKSRLLTSLFFLYFAYLPAIFARLIGADPSAYRYLPDSVRRYPTPERVAEIMQNAGLHNITFERRLGGIIVLHRGVA